MSTQVCLCFLPRTNLCWSWLFSSTEQHIVPGGHHSLACVDGKDQVWLGNSSLHIKCWFWRPPLLLVPINQERVIVNLQHVYHLRTFFLGPGWHSVCITLCCHSLSGLLCILPIISSVVPPVKLCSFSNENILEVKHSSGINACNTTKLGYLLIQRCLV